MAGEVVMLTSHGRTIAELKPPTDHKAEAKAQLQAIAAQAHFTDVLTPVLDHFAVME